MYRKILFRFISFRRLYMFSPRYKRSDRCCFPWINRRNLLLAVSIFSLIFISCCDLSAQTLNATLRGTVTDSSGASVAGAEITLLEQTTGQTVRKASSQASGDFEFDELKPGTYELRCG